MKICITGAAGRLGWVAVARLAKAGHEVVASDRSFAKIEGGSGGYRFVVADLRVREHCYGLLEGVDVLIHLGNHSHQFSADPQTIYNDNTSMTMNVFQAALEMGTRRIVYASSVQASSGSRTSEEQPSQMAYLPLDGGLPTKPANTYAASKEAGELLLRYYCQIRGMTGIALRFPALLPLEYLVEPPGKRKRGSFQSNPDETAVYLPISEAARLIETLLARPGEGFHILLPGMRDARDPRPLHELIQTRYRGVPLRRPLEAMTSLIDIEAIEALTGFAPKTLEEVIAEEAA
jgi:UDP-glucose 4-epimerase